MKETLSSSILRDARNPPNHLSYPQQILIELRATISLISHAEQSHVMTPAYPI